MTWFMHLEVIISYFIFDSSLLFSSYSTQSKFNMFLCIYILQEEVFKWIKYIAGCYSHIAIHCSHNKCSYMFRSTLPSL
jgi:hypothetical protein